MKEGKGLARPGRLGRHDYSKAREAGRWRLDLEIKAAQNIANREEMESTLIKGIGQKKKNLQLPNRLSRINYYPGLEGG